MEREYACPGCGFLVLGEPPGGTFAICPICRWEDCNIQFEDPSYDGGPNGISLADHQGQLLQHLPASVREHRGYRRDPQWRPLAIDQ